jgi:hypothetical protein
MASNQVQRIGLAKCFEMVRIEEKADEFHTIMDIVKEGYTDNTEPSEEGKGSNKESKEDGEMIWKDADKGISMKRMIPKTRQSERLQNQLMRKFQMKGGEESKKRTLEGMELSTETSFSILSNDKISDLAADMGVEISLDNFDSIDIMKDLEMARLALNKAKCVKPPN